MGEKNKTSTTPGSKDLESSASRRVDQISQHIEQSDSAQVRRRRRNSAADDGLPADHSDLLGQLRTLRGMAANPGPTNKGYVRQKQSGKLWVRERVEQLLDRGSFKEVGSVSGTGDLELIFWFFV